MSLRIIYGKAGTGKSSFIFNEINEKNADIVSHIFIAINKIVKELNIADSGYRIINNCGVDGGQTVNHMHFHVLGARELKWPPG